MPKTRSSSRRVVGATSVITKTDSMIMRSGRSRKEVTPKNQRRNFTAKRQLRAKSFLNKVAVNPRFYGPFMSRAWMKALLYEINEPEIVTLRNVEEWVSKQTAFFSVASKKANNQRRSSRFTTNRQEEAFKIKIEVEDTDSVCTSTEGIFEEIDTKTFVSISSVYECTKKVESGEAVSDIKKFNRYDAVSKVSSKKYKKSKIQENVPLPSAPIPLPPPESKETQTDSGQCDSCDNISAFIRKHLGVSFCEEIDETATDDQCQRFPTDSGIDSMGTQTSTTVTTIEEVMYITLEDKQTMRVNTGPDVIVDEPIDVDDDEGDKQTKTVNTGPDVIIEEPIDVDDDDEGGNEQSRHKRVNTGPDVIIEEPIDVNDDNEGDKEQSDQQQSEVIEVIDTDVENQEVEQIQLPCVNIQPPFVCPPTFLVNSNDLIQFAQAAGTSGHIVQPDIFQSRDMYLLNSTKTITVQDHAVTKIQENVHKYNSVLSAYDLFIFEFEKWHGFTIEPRNYEISQMFTELRSKLESMQEELIEYLLR